VVVSSNIDNPTMGLWIGCGNENAAFTVGWKKFAETEKGAVGQAERESHVDRFFGHRGCCTS
jgi:hypothetical protein